MKQVNDMATKCGKNTYDWLVIGYGFASDWIR